MRDEEWFMQKNANRWHQIPLYNEERIFFGFFVALPRADRAYKKREGGSVQFFFARGNATVESFFKESDLLRLCKRNVCIR